MKNGIGSGTAKSAKNLAQAVAKQFARESQEILRTAKSQVAGETLRPQEAPQNSPQEAGAAGNPEGHGELQDKIKAVRRMEALNRELEDMHKQEVFKDLQKRISQGEEIPLENYSELSMEQKQVLRAQMEAVKIQKEQMENQSVPEVPGVRSKPSRRFGAGQKREAEKQQTRVEKPVPPSG